MTDETPALAQYSRRASQGVVLGIDKPGVWSIGIALAPVGVTVLAEGPIKALLVAVVMSPLAVSGLLKRHGIALSMWLVWAMKFRMRKMMGRTKYTRKVKRAEPIVRGELQLPGLEERFQVWESPSGVAVIWDKMRQSASVTCMVASPGMARHRTQVMTPHDQEELTSALMRVAGSWTRRRQIMRVSMQERTRPGTIVREQRAFEQLGATGDLADSYQEALGRVAQESVLHPQSITLTIDAGGGEGRATAKDLGGGKAGILGMVEQELAATAESLRVAGFTRIAWCSPREWGAWGRGIVDPVAEGKIDVRLGTAFQGIAPELAGPMACVEEKNHVETDSAFHRVYWISEYPRLPSLPGFMGEVASAESSNGVPVRHTLQLVGTPVPIEEALKGIRKQRDAWKQNAALKARRNADMTIADNADWENLDARERDLISGQGELAWTGFVVVSALSYEALLSACTTMELAGSTASIELTALSYQQAAALMTVAYPAGTGM
ncbi:PrgI family protein [Leucobacter musarum]|uniref:PrgI family protein n=1 Tax=Leucobacter musarum TaxID=1930747 RepID=UPI0006A7BD3C|nr:PrgI family protein [Leucobacter musarum]